MCMFSVTDASLLTPVQMGLYTLCHELRTESKGICPILSKYQQSKWYTIDIYLVNQASKGATLNHNFRLLK